MRSLMVVVKRLSPPVSIMALTYTETEHYHKIVKHIIKSMKQKYGLNPYMDDAIETTLPMCKCSQSIMPVINIRTEK